jgi:hypothetical protein
VQAADQEASVRRSLYFFHSNNDRNAFLTTFDEAMVKDCYKRDQSIVPQQALALSNSKLVFESAPGIVAGIEKKMQSVADDREFVRLAFESIVGFAPDAEEMQIAMDGLKAFTKSGQATSAHASGARQRLVWALLNHNDFVQLR